MSLTASASGNRMQLWSKELFKDVIDGMYFTQNGLMGKGDNNIVQLFDDLKKSPGDRITVPLTAKLTGSGVTGDSELEGNEESILVAGLVFLLERGVPGRTLEAMRVDEQLARAMGVNVAIWRAATFVLCAALGGLAGAANTLQIGLATPEAASFSVIIEVLTIVVVGGTGAWYGPLMGAFVILWLPEVLSFSGEWRTIVQGLVVVLIVVFMPNGFVGLVQRLASMVSRRRASNDGAASQLGATS